VLDGNGPALSLETLIFKQPYLLALQAFTTLPFERIAAAAFQPGSLRRP